MFQQRLVDDLDAVRKSDGVGNASAATLIRLGMVYKYIMCLYITVSKSIIDLYYFWAI